MLDATLKKMSDGSVSSKRLPADNADCEFGPLPDDGCWNPVGETDPDLSNRSVLLELIAQPVSGPWSGILPTATADQAVGRLQVGPAGRVGSRGCTATLVAPQWVMTVASCLGDRSTLSAGPPPVATKVSFAGQVARKVVHLVPHPGRDLALARLEVGIVGITPSPLAGAAPAGGQAVQVRGFGRTGTDWGPEAAHGAAATVTAVAAGTATLSTSGPVCKGDAGGPVLNGPARSPRW